MDALMPLACLPVPIAGRNRLWRDMIVDAIQIGSGLDGRRLCQRSRVAGLETAADIHRSSPAARRSRCRRPCRPARRRRRLSGYVSRRPALRAWTPTTSFIRSKSSRDYDPSAKLEAISAPVMWINSADDFINPPELGIAEREASRLKRGTLRAAAHRPQHPRPRHPHLGGGVEAVSRRAAGGVGAVIYLLAGLLLWEGWAVSWMIAALWTRRTVPGHAWASAWLTAHRR